jgi:arylsulfatase A-like enzyme
MEQYCHQQGFETINDDKTISCTFGKMEKTHSVLDGLNDRCLIERYFEWSSHFNEEKKFTIMWTNQTHYPYFVNGTPERYTTDEDLNNYLNALKNSDLAFGQLMEQLKEHHELESTLVIVIGDHGEAFGTHNQYVHASNIFEENVHIPCILFNPILFKGTTDDRISGLIDIAPTIAQVAGIKKPESWQGTSLLNEDKMQEGRTFFISPYSNFLLGTRYKDWKFIYDGTTNEKKLYDLKTDPEELNNIAALHPDIVKVEFEMLAGWVQYQNDKTKEWINKP